MKKQDIVVHVDSPEKLEEFRILLENAGEKITTEENMFNLLENYPQANFLRYGEYTGDWRLGTNANRFEVSIEKLKNILEDEKVQN